MSKYTESLNEITKYQVELEYTMQGTDKWRNAMWTCKEALEIADRLEQAMTDEQTADCIIVDVGCVNNEHDKEVWLNGYNQALVDVRGEENGK